MWPPSPNDQRHQARTIVYADSGMSVMKNIKQTAEYLFLLISCWFHTLSNKSSVLCQGNPYKSKSNDTTRHGREHQLLSTHISPFSLIRDFYIFLMCVKWKYCVELQGADLKAMRHVSSWPFLSPVFLGVKITADAPTDTLNHA